MKLIYAKPSPYSRKARVTLIEKGLQDRIETEISNPLQDEDVLLSANPLGKVPALVLDDGTALFDSSVICEYLDSLAPAPALLETGRDRWTLARQMSLADGVLDAAVSYAWRACGRKTSSGACGPIASGAPSCAGST